MNNKGFTVERIKVEGFKGFSVGQTIPINGKHLFILGPNSFGKSSLVEAIRWGLFGSTRRQGEVVANQRYTGSCRVELGLRREDKHWILKRTLIRGVSGGSDADIVDETGQSHSLREILPQLTSIPAGEGMHIVYAAQSAPQRRAVEDLTPFEQTIYSHLGLADVKITISGLDDFVEKHVLSENALAKEVEEKRNHLESELSHLTEQRQRVIENPPWDDENVPIQTDTGNRIKTFIEQISVSSSVEPMVISGSDIFLLIAEAESILNRSSDRSSTNVEAALTQTRTRIAEGESLSAELALAISKLEKIREEIASTSEMLELALGSVSLESFAEAVEQLDQDVKDKALVFELQKKARIWVERHLKDPGEQHCPICEGEYEVTTLLDSLGNRLTLASAEEAAVVARRDELKNRYDEMSRLRNKLSEWGRCRDAAD